MAADILDALLLANVVLVAAILLVFLLRSPVRWIAGARAAYALWVIPPIAIAGTLIPPGKAAVRVWPAPEAAQALPASANPPLGPVESAASPAGFSGADLLWVLLAVWLAGVVVSTLALLAKHRAAMAALGELKPDGGMLRTENPAIGPAVIGLFKPRIVLPTDFETRYDEREQQAVIAHEQAHLAGRHVAAKALAQALVCINWFNPLAHMAASAMATDQELACDEAVIGKDPQVRKAYAKALLKTQTGCVLPLGCSWPPCTARLLRLRISLVCAGAKGRVARAGGAAAVGVLALGAGLAAWAAQPTPVVEFRDIRAEVVTLTPPPPAAASGRLRNEAAVAAAIKAGRPRDVLVAGGTPTETADALRAQIDRRRWSTDMLPVRGSEQFASFQDGEFGIAGRTAAGKLVIVNDGGFDEYPHFPGMAAAQTVEVVRPGRPVVVGRHPSAAQGLASVASVSRAMEISAPAYTEEQRLAAFGTNDRDRDGRLDPTEYMGVLQTLGFTDQFSVNWPRRDANRDGVVTFEEYRSPLAALAAPVGAAVQGSGAQAAERRQTFAAPVPMRQGQTATRRQAIRPAAPQPAPRGGVYQFRPAEPSLPGSGQAAPMPIAP